MNQRVNGSGLFRVVLVLAGVLLVAPLPGRVAAQTADNEAVQGMVDELRGIVDQGERYRSADPRFLEDLRRLARKYDWPWRRVVLDETFADGDYTHNPSWTVASGRFWIDRQLGLRSVVEAAPPAAAAGGGQPSQESTQRDPALDLFGAVLRGMTQPRDGTEGGSGTSAGAQAGPAAAEIHTAQPFANAFAVTVRLRTLRAMPSRLEIAAYQGADRAVGYRLRYGNDGRPTLELARRTAYGTSTIYFAAEGVPPIDDGNPHEILWTRDSRGNMAIGIDGAALVRADDRGLGDSFHGLALVNGAGDYAVSRVMVRDIAR